MSMRTFAIVLVCAVVLMFTRGVITVLPFSYGPGKEVKMKTLVLILVVGIILPNAAMMSSDVAEAGVACWVYRNMGNHPLAWDLCMLEIWAASGNPEYPDPGEGGPNWPEW